VSALNTIASRPASQDIYTTLTAVLDQIGEYDVQDKKTSLHITHGRAFLGVHPRANGLLLNIVTTTALPGPRIRKREQVSANRCHNEILITSPDDLDNEFAGWITQAHRLTVG
jgi:hypothetical protein